MKTFWRCHAIFFGLLAAVCFGSICATAISETANDGRLENASVISRLMGIDTFYHCDVYSRRYSGEDPDWKCDHEATIVRDGIVLSEQEIRRNIWLSLIDAGSGRDCILALFFLFVAFFPHMVMADLQAKEKRRKSRLAGM